MEWHWVMQFLWKNSTGTIPAIFKLYGSMGFKQPQKKPIYMLGPQLDAAVASPDHLTVDFWYANVPAQVNFKAIHHHH